MTTAEPPPRTRRTLSTRIRLSQAEQDAIRATATAKGLTVAALMRSAALALAGFEARTPSRARKPTIYAGPRFDGRGRYKWTPWLLATKQGAWWDRQARAYLTAEQAAAAGLPAKPDPARTTTDQS